MKLFLALFALVASTAADVSHLSREYLPPVQHDHHAQHGGAATTHFGSISGSSAGASAGPSGTVTYTSQQHSFAAAAPAAEEPAASEPVAPADDGAAAAYGSYDAGDQQQYQFVPEAQQQVDAGVGGGNAGVVGADSGSGGVDGADGGAYSGSYDLGTQDAGVQDVADNSLTDSYGNSVGHVSLAAAQGPTIRAPQPAVSHFASHDAVAEYVGGGAGAGAVAGAGFGGGVSGSSGLDTQYGSNGGYVY